MGRHFITVFVAFLLAVPLFDQRQSPEKADEATVAAFAQKAAVGALNFHQGEVSSLMRARADFTPEGWKDFMKHMEGFLDSKGAPTFSSTFKPARNATIIGVENGVVHVRIPGTLKQTENQSSTTYRAVIDVYALRDLLIHGGSPLKIQHLEQITCAGATTGCE